MDLSGCYGNLTEWYEGEGCKAMLISFTIAETEESEEKHDQLSSHANVSQYCGTKKEITMEDEQESNGY